MLLQPVAAETTYTLDFVHEKMRYSYEVQAGKGVVIASEKLYTYPKGSARLLFARTQDSKHSVQVKAGASLRGATQEVRHITQTGQLFLSVAREYGHETLAPVAQPLARAGGSLLHEELRLITVGQYSNDYATYL